MEKITVGIIGCGFVGGALKVWLEENNKDVKVVVSDPPKGMNDDISGADVYFLQIHVPTDDNGRQDLTLMTKLISELPDKPVFVRTTILPGTSEKLSKETGHRVYFMPEFLTERTYIEDFKHQPMVFTGEVDLLYDYCRRMGADWSSVHAGMLLSGYINDTHTYVPGPDGKFGYGGKCFPKDVNAFTIMTQGTPLGQLLTPLHTLNVHFRGHEEHI